MPASEQEAVALKDSGNELFKSGKYSEALDVYSQALALTSPAQTKDKTAIFKNQAACYLKLQDYEKCVQAASDALELTPSDPKALFRRLQALESLGKLDEAFKDARLAAHAEPGNGALQEAVTRLRKKLDEQAKKQSSTEQKVTDMLQYFGKEPDLEKRRQAANNLVVLAREKAGAERLMAKKAPEQFAKMLKDRTLDGEIRLAIVRAIGEMFKGDVGRCRELLRNRVGLPPLLELYCVESEELVTAVSVAIENILHALSDWVDKDKPDKKVIEANQEDIDHVLTSLTELSDKAVLSAVGRDSVIDLILKNLPENLSPGLGWTEPFMVHGGIGKFLHIAVVQPMDRETVGSSLRVTNETRIHVALALQKIYDDLDSDRKRNMFREKCETFVQGILVDPDPDTKIQAVLAIIALLQGPFDVGNYLLGSKGILEMLLVMANCDEDPQQQIVAAEAIVHAASKKDKCTAILGDGVTILQRLSRSTNDKVQVRALVGLCKVGSSGGIDAANRPLSEETITKLADSCRRFMANPDKDFDLRRWAAEGLAYLTLDANVKESLIEDKAALRSLIALGKTGNQNVVYGVVSVLVNLTNAYDKQDVVPELKELAKFAKQHVPTEHEKDALEFISKRVGVLVEEGVGSALVALSKSESKSIRELIARVMNVIVENKEHRGVMVQQGAAKVLIKLALSGTEKGMECASQALARIGITISPDIAFPGQRSCEVVRPILNLLDVEKTALANFEALLALTNLAQLSESVRQRIVKEQGVSKIEHYLYEEHELLRRAATECICNLMLCPDVQEVYIKSEADRIKLLILYCAEEDPALAKAAAGALAMLSEDERACERIIEPTVWLDVMKEISVSEHVELRLRALFILANLIKFNATAAEAITKCELLEILMATSQLTGSENARMKELALRALRAAHKRKLIAPNPEYDEEED